VGGGCHQPPAGGPGGGPPPPPRGGGGGGAPTPVRRPPPRPSRRTGGDRRRARSGRPPTPRPPTRAQRRGRRRRQRRSTRGTRGTGGPPPTGPPRRRRRWRRRRPRRRRAAAAAPLRPSGPRPRRGPSCRTSRRQGPTRKGSGPPSPDRGGEEDGGGIRGEEGGCAGGGHGVRCATTSRWGPASKAKTVTGHIDIPPRGCFNLVLCFASRAREQRLPNASSVPAAHRAGRNRGHGPRPLGVAARRVPPALSSASPTRLFFSSPQGLCVSTSACSSPLFSSRCPRPRSARGTLFPRRARCVGGDAAVRQRRPLVAADADGGVPTPRAGHPSFTATPHAPVAARRRCRADTAAAAAAAFAGGGLVAAPGVERGARAWRRRRRRLASWWSPPVAADAPSAWGGRPTPAPAAPRAAAEAALPHHPIGRCRCPLHPVHPPSRLLPPQGSAAVHPPACKARVAATPAVSGTPKTPAPERGGGHPQLGRPRRPYLCVGPPTPRFPHDSDRGGGHRGGAGGSAGRHRHGPSRQPAAAVRSAVAARAGAIAAPSTAADAWCAHRGYVRGAGGASAARDACRRRATGGGGRRAGRGGSPNAHRGGRVAPRPRCGLSRRRPRRQWGGSCGRDCSRSAPSGTAASWSPQSPTSATIPRAVPNVKAAAAAALGHDVSPSWHTRVGDVSVATTDYVGTCNCL